MKSQYCNIAIHYCNRSFHVVNTFTHARTVGRGTTSRMPTARSGGPPDCGNTHRLSCGGSSSALAHQLRSSTRCTVGEEGVRQGDHLLRHRLPSGDQEDQRARARAAPGTRGCLRHGPGRSQTTSSFTATRNGMTPGPHRRLQATHQRTDRDGAVHQQMRPPAERRSTHAGSEGQGGGQNIASATEGTVVMGAPVDPD